MQGGCIGEYPSGVGSSLFLERVLFYDPPGFSVEKYDESFINVHRMFICVILIMVCRVNGYIDYTARIIKI